MRRFLAVAAILAWVFGLAMLVKPSGMYAPLGIVMTSLIATLAQAHGATLIGLGVVTWMARDATGRGLVAVLAGNLVVHVLALSVVVRTATVTSGNPLAVAPEAVIHVALGSGFAFFLVRARRS
jgi:hypothetical protein